MANGLIDPRGFQLVPDIAGAQQAGLALQQQRQGIQQQTAQNVSQRDQLTLNALVSGAQILKGIGSQEGKIAFLQQQRVQFERAGFPTQGIDEALQLANQGNFAQLEAETDRLIGSRQEPFTLSPGQVRFAGGQAIAAAPEGGSKQVQTNKLRSTINNNLGEFRKVDSAFRRIQAVATKPTAAGDLALIFNFMKMLDPGSTVREGEFATAQNAAGVPDRIKNVFNRIISGERLAPAQRADFVQQADNLFTAQRQSADVQIGNILQQADQDDIARIKVLGKERLKEFEDRQAQQPTAQQPITQPGQQAVSQFSEGQTATNPQTGEKLIFRNGRWEPN